MNILPRRTLTVHEESELMEVLRYPILKKYFEVLAHNIACDLATIPIAADERPEQYIMVQQSAHGQLIMLDTLNSAILASTKDSL